MQRLLWPSPWLLILRPQVHDCIPPSTTQPHTLLNSNHLFRFVSSTAALPYNTSCESTLPTTHPHSQTASSIRSRKLKSLADTEHLPWKLHYLTMTKGESRGWILLPHSWRRDTQEEGDEFHSANPRCNACENQPLFALQIPSRYCKFKPPEFRF